jgi:N-acyl-D-amino-acid deacylase
MAVADRPTLLRGGLIVDGTGSPGLRADVLIHGERIEGVAPRIEVTDDQVDEIVDLAGLVLSPGFIDMHTHFDAQLLWDGALTPSPWHGVTTVLMGNCGFGIAPARPDDRRTLLRTLENVEGMSYAALQAGVEWAFQSFTEYLDHVDSLALRANVMAFVGHTALRLFAMGGQAYERLATDDEVAAMVRHLVTAVEAGAVGLSSSKGRFHFGADGKPVPSRLARTGELEALLAAIAGRAALNQFATGDDLTPDEIVAMCRRIGAPMTWTPVVADAANPGAAVRLARRLAASQERIWSQFPCRPVVMQVTMLDPYPFASARCMKPVVSAPLEARKALYERLLGSAGDLEELNATWSHRWSKTFVDETALFGELRGASLADIAARHGTSPARLLLDLSLQEDLRTRFRVVLANDGEAEIGELLVMDELILGLSDAGAHADQLCDAGFATDLLGGWVRDRQAVTLERAVWRLTGQPAQALGLRDRGRIAPGWIADLVAFNPATVACGQLERVADLPAGAERLIARSAGVEHVWLAGVATRRDGQELPGRSPGRLLRASPA